MQELEKLQRWAQANRVDVAELGRVTSAVEAGGLTLPGLAIEPFYEAGSFDWEAEAAARAEGLADELRALDGRLSTHPETDVLIIRGSWEAFFLWRGGSERPSSSAEAPVAKAVTSLAEGGGDAGNAYYSVLGPGTEIKAHTGRFNARLRCHVGLSIPDAGWIEVAGERRSWEAGKCLVFSDALPHHVVMDGSEPRSVFAFDFWHPDVTKVERAALSMLLTSKG